MSSRIEDYALIGDCETAALVGRDGSIDWLCWPRFDSGACFAALLGTEENGRWLLAPEAAGARITRRYRQDTLVLETDFETDEGAVTVIDFMPVRDGVPDLIRIVVGRSGQLRMNMELLLRFDYGKVVPWVSRQPDGTNRAIAGPNKVRLSASVEVHGEALKTVAQFTVAAGQRQHFVLSYGESHLPDVTAQDPEKALAATEEFWRSWAGRCSYRGAWPAVVKRSLITLKALTYAPTGGLVAAATTSLPSSSGCQGTRAHARCGSVTMPHRSFRSTFLAKSWTRCIKRAARGCPPAPLAGRSSAPCSSTWRRSGHSRTAEFGRCGERYGTSRTPR